MRTVRVRRAFNRIARRGKVSVVIPTYNRFEFLINAIRSIENQTYRNVEIIVVNDGSTQKEYYEKFVGNAKMIHCRPNSSEICGFPNLNRIRNVGLANASGDFVAFLDDDDVWLPHKLETQLQTMSHTGCSMACSDGYIGVGEYDSSKSYRLYLAEHYYDTVMAIYQARNCEHFFQNGEYPQIWTRDFLRIHNCVTTCSVLVARSMINKAGKMPESIPPGEDYRYWLKLLEFGNFAYVSQPCFYCDEGHGRGRNY